MLVALPLVTSQELVVMAGSLVSQRDCPPQTRACWQKQPRPAGLKAGASLSYFWRSRLLQSFDKQKPFFNHVFLNEEEQGSRRALVACYVASGRLLSPGSLRNEIVVV